MERTLNLYFNIFKSTFMISAFTFGGGYVIIPLLKKRFVDDYKWIEEEEMMNLIAIAQSSPGAVAVNASVIIGYRIGGIKGGITAVLGTVMPPLILLSAVSYFYVWVKENTVIKYMLKGMQAGVASVILDVVFKMAVPILKKREVVPGLIMVISFIMSYVFHINVSIVVVLSGIMGALWWKMIGKKGGKEN